MSTQTTNDVQDRAMQAGTSLEAANQAMLGNAPRRLTGPAAPLPDSGARLMATGSTAPLNAAATGSPPVFTIVAPVFNEEETLPRFYQRVVDAMEHIGEPFELVLVDDGSGDGSSRVMRELHYRDPRVRCVTFSRNFGHQAAISAGLQAARGQAVVIIDSDLQDPPEVIPDLVARCA
jgi:cellulose synthase/poly-beta-1,6-N-acetylglucosamine synthase-like glycosyltransferase